jgi:hypothetical protein
MKGIEFQIILLPLAPSRALACKDFSLRGKRRSILLQRRLLANQKACGGDCSCLAEKSCTADFQISFTPYRLSMISPSV